MAEEACSTEEEQAQVASSSTSALLAAECHSHPAVTEVHAENTTCRPGQYCEGAVSTV